MDIHHLCGFILSRFRQVWDTLGTGDIVGPDYRTLHSAIAKNPKHLVSRLLSLVSACSDCSVWGLLLQINMWQQFIEVAVLLIAISLRMTTALGANPLHKRTGDHRIERPPVLAMPRGVPCDYVFTPNDAETLHKYQLFVLHTIKKNTSKKKTIRGFLIRRQISDRNHYSRRLLDRQNTGHHPAVSVNSILL